MPIPPELISNRRHFLRTAGLLGITGWLSSLNLIAAAKPLSARFLKQWGNIGIGPGEFNSPIGIAIDHRDHIHVTDFRNKRVQSFDRNGKFLAAIPVQIQPGGLAVDRSGIFYVAHWNQNKVAAYSPTGEVIREWGRQGTGDGEFRLAGGLVISRDNSIYVADQGNSRIQKFTLEGRYLGQWGKPGDEPGEFGGGRSPGSRFAGPQWLALDRHDNVYATDAVRGRVQKFTSDGKFLSEWGSNRTEPGGFGGRFKEELGPIALCVDRKDRVWVGASNQRVQLFDPNGKFLCGMGGEGSEPGQFSTPHGLAIDSHGDLYVVDSMNCRIQKFAPPR